MARRSRHVGFLYFFAGLPFNIGCLLVNEWLCPPLIAEFLFPFHLGFLTCAALLLTAHLLGRYSPFVCATVSVAVVAVLAASVALSVDVGGWTTGGKFLTAVAVFSVILCPLTSVRGAVGHSGTLVALLYLAHLGPAGIAGVTWSTWIIPVTDSLFVLGGVFTFAVLRAGIIRTAKRAFHDQLAVAPKQIVVAAALADEKFEELFAPTTRFSVCLCSDWRGYQALSAAVPPAELADGLAAYYASVELALGRIMPAGNYFVDWIADELFVVIYAGPDDDERTCVAAAIRFGRELLELKRVAMESRGFPLAIDVGISAGESLLGVMGPANQRKFTALGDVPGRARRIEGAGKFLRGRFGPLDRIVFGDDVMTRLFLPVGVVEYELEPHERLRDVADRAVYFIELEDCTFEANLGKGSLKRAG